MCFCFLLALLGARPLPPLTNVNNRWMRTHRASLAPTLVRWEVRRGLPHYELSLRVPSGSFIFCYMMPYFSSGVRCRFLVAYAARRAGWGPVGCIVAVSVCPQCHFADFTPCAPFSPSYGLRHTCSCFEMSSMLLV